jgi:hypothetical protein
MKLSPIDEGILADILHHRGMDWLLEALVKHLDRPGAENYETRLRDGIERVGKVYRLRHVGPDVPLIEFSYFVGAYGEWKSGPGARCWGWYLTFDECLQRMGRDRLFFESGHYTYGIIEKYPYGDSLPTETYWFEPVAEGVVVPCAEPESARKTIGFLL